MELVSIYCAFTAILCTFIGSVDCAFEFRQPCFFSCSFAHHFFHHYEMYMMRKFFSVTFLVKTTRWSEIIAEFSVVAC